MPLPSPVVPYNQFLSTNFRKADGSAFRSKYTCRYLRRHIYYLITISYRVFKIKIILASSQVNNYEALNIPNFCVCIDLFLTS